MFVDGRSIASGEVLRFDVCVVGAGPAGILLADELGKVGFRVLLLERGDGSSWGNLPDTALNGGLDYDLANSRASGFGGSANRWGIVTPWGNHFVRLRELDEQDFVRKEWVRHSGWPVDKVHLRSYYDRAWSMFGAEQISESYEDLNPLEQNPFRDPEGVIQESIFSFAPSTIFTHDLKHELAGSTNVTVLTNAAVTDIRCDGSPSSVSSVLVAVDGLKNFSVEARLFLLAAGGIENPRLLLSSRSRHPKGLGNTHDLVGRFFMEHPHYTSGILWPADSAPFDGSMSYAFHLQNNFPGRRKYELSEKVVTDQQLLRSCFELNPTPLDARFRRLYYSEPARRSILAGENARRALVGRPLASHTAEEVKHALLGIHHIARFGIGLAADRVGRRLGFSRLQRPQAFTMRVYAEQVPDPENRVELTDSNDPFGVPIARLSWRLTDQDLDSYQRSQEMFARGLLRAGHRKVDSLVKRTSLPQKLNGGNHHMGTTRMAEDPLHGVVDANCQVHGMDNLYVAGSSVFPTGGYANPTLTIMALTLRLAEHCRGRLRRPESVHLAEGQAEWESPAS